MQLFGHYFFEDPEERKFREEWEEKRSQRVIEQCIHYGSKDDKVFWDMIELPRKSVQFTHEDTAREDFRLHAQLMKKQECHVFYGKKYCYHIGIEQITELDNNETTLPKPNQGEIVEKP